MIKYIIGWAPSFSLLVIVTQKDCLYYFIRILKVTLRSTLIQNRGLCPLMLLPLITDFFVFMHHSGHNTRKQQTRGYFFEWQQHCMESKNEGNEEKKFFLMSLVVLWIKWTGIMEIKYKKFIDVVPIMPCQKSSRSMTSRIFGERWIQIPLSLLTTIDPFAEDPG